MSTTPNYASTPDAGAALLTTANTGTRAAPVGDSVIFTPGASGGQVERITVEPVATTVAGTVQVFRNIGASKYLYAEIQLQIQTASTGMAITPQTLEAVNYPNLFPIILPAGATLSAALSVAQTGVVVQAEGGSY